MERCDASIFAGGGDVRSGECRPGGRYAGPAVSPRQLHRGTEQRPRSTGRASTSAARRATALRHELRRCDENRRRQRSACDGLEMEQVQRISAMAGHGQSLRATASRLRRLRRLQFAVGRRRRRPRGELHARQNSAVSQTGSMSRFYHASFGVHGSAPPIKAPRSMNISDMGTLRVRGGYVMAVRSCLMCSPASRWGRPTSSHRTRLRHSVNPAATPAFRTCHSTSARPTPAQTNLVYGYSRRPRHRRDAGRRPVHARRMGISSLRRRRSTPASTPSAPASATSSDPVAAASIRRR